MVGSLHEKESRPLRAKGERLLQEWAWGYALSISKVSLPLLPDVSESLADGTSQQREGVADSERGQLCHGPHLRLREESDGDRKQPGGSCFLPAAAKIQLRLREKEMHRSGITFSS
eukprot:752753-Hanusia_phi.AAC.5